MRKTTRDMSDQHESFLARMLAGRKSKGSGNQFNDQMDGRNRQDTPYALAWDGKSTLGESIGVTLQMWVKAAEQAGGEIPMLALRWYTNERLTAVGADLVALDIHDFVSILNDARKYQASQTIYDRTGQLDEQVIDDLVDEWHGGIEADIALHTYLGMTPREYCAWVFNSSDIPEHLRKPEPIAQVEDDEHGPPGVDDWWADPPGEQD